MRRLTLSTKLFAAALPLVLAVGALLALTVRNDLNEVAEAERGADLGSVWTPLVAALNQIESELDLVPATSATAATAGDGSVAAGPSTDLVTLRRSTDQSLTALGDSVGDLGAAEAARKHITQARTDISGARRAIDMASLAPGMSIDVDPLAAYDSALRELVSVGQLLPAESGEANLGRELLAVVKLAEARAASDAVIANVERFSSNTADPSPLATAQVRFAEIESVLNEFSAIAPEEWAKEFRQSDFTTGLSRFRFDLDAARRAAEAGSATELDLTEFEAMSDRSLALQQEITGSIVDRATTQADETRQAVFVRSLIALGAVLIAALTAWLLTRSVTRRVKTVSRRANQVANEQLPALVDAIRDPRGKTVLPTIAPVDTRGSDELAELADAFNSMQGTLVDVANEQVEVLRRGVSEIFVTMARRNRSLIDRQLAMLDEFEAEVDDPEVLANYYQLDHMATRMRRSSESLLVLANAEPKRRRVKATEIDDVVRAAIGEVEDYRRIEVEALENLQVRGNVVADVSHLLAELLDNATSFSPPDSVVRVGGRRAGDSYMLRIVDSGVGISPDRLTELNELLREPPIVGLSVEPTLGMSVVSLLAARHGVTVTLSQGNPGTTVDVLLPSTMFGPIEVPGLGSDPGAAMPRLAAGATAVAPQGPVTTADLAVDPMPAPAAAAAAAGMPYDVDREPGVLAPPAEIERSVEPDVTPSWASMSLDLAGLRAEPSQAAGDDPTPIASPGLFADIPSFADTESEVGLDSESEPATPSWFADDTESSDDTDDAVAAAPAADPILSLRIPDPVYAEPADTHDDSAPEDDLATVAEADAPEELQLPTRSSMPTPTPELAATAPVAEVGEFDRPPAPPMTADGLSRRPVTPDDARPTSTVKLPAPSLDAGLPTRTPGRGPDGGPDRLAPPTGPSVIADMPVAPTSSPTALQNALAAFDSRRNGNDSLPTRSRNTESAVPSSFDEPASTTQSRLDPEVLRERLRAFQNEFRTASVGSDSKTDSSTNPDLGGDR